jgi:hypothetical protein
MVATQALYHLSHTPLVLLLIGFFWDRVSQALGTPILLISASQIARITGVSYRCPALPSVFNRTVFFEVQNIFGLGQLHKGHAWVDTPYLKSPLLKLKMIAGLQIKPGLYLQKVFKWTLRRSLQKSSSQTKLFNGRSYILKTKLKTTSVY